MKILRSLGFDEAWLSLAAADAAGDLIIRIDLVTWEQMQASGADWMEADDRRDHALSLIETRASRIQPAMSHQGRTITIT